MLDPVSALKVYLQETDKLRANDTGLVFLTLNPPYHGIVSDIINHARDLAGLKGRCSVQNISIQARANQEVVCQLGWWKTSSDFFEHYVHTSTPVSLVEATISNVV
jgi:hypothetical protein